MKLFSFNFSGQRLYPWRQRLIEWGSAALLIALLIGPIGFLGWLVFFTNTFTVQAITVVDARDHTAESIRTQANTISGKNIMFIQTALLEQRLLAEIPQLRDVHIVRKLPGTLKIIAQEKNPALLLLSNTKYHFVDSEGIVYEPARLETLPGIVLPTIKNDDTNAEVTLGIRAVDPTFVEFVIQAEKELGNTVGARVAEIRIPSLAAREVHLYLDNNWVIRLDSTRSLNSQLEVLQSLLDHTISAEQRPQIEYIDLRIPNRVYYKYINNSPAPPKS